MTKAEDKGFRHAVDTWLAFVVPFLEGLGPDEELNGLTVGKAFVKAHPQEAAALVAEWFRCSSNDAMAWNWREKRASVRIFRMSVVVLAAAVLTFLASAIWPDLP